MPEHFSDEWSACLESFIRSISEKTGSKHSAPRYKRVLDAYFAMRPGVSPERFTRSDVEAFMRLPGTAPGRVGNPITFATMGNRLSVVSSFYKFSSTYGVLGDDGLPHALLTSLSPCAGIRTPERERPPYRSLDEQALKAFFAAIPTTDTISLRNRAIFLTLFWSARRVNEILELKWSDIKPAIFSENGVRRHGFVYSWRGKGKQRFVDSAELVPQAMNSITTYLSAAGRLETIQGDDYIFIAEERWKRRTRETQTRIAGATIWAYAKKYGAAAGLPVEQVTCHSFRHAAALARYLAGQGIFEIKTLLRHSSLDHTAIYLRELASEADSGVSLLEARFASL
jgi:site-specific recombinase XerD